MSKILECRRKIAEYKEIYYLVFILIMGGLASAGFTSEMKFYQIFFAIAALFWLVKMIVTDYSVTEIVIIGVIMLLLGINFLGNHEKTLIITGMAIFGAKQVSLEKVFQYGLWTKLVLTVGLMGLAMFGIIENQMLNLPKNYQRVELYCYGYIHPNVAFANLLMILLMAVVVYGDRLKWYIYVGMSLIMLGAYKILMCRTGLIVWIVLCLIVLGFRVTRRWKIGKVYQALMVAMPLVLAVFSFVLPALCWKDPELAQKMNYYLTGRMDHINQYRQNMGILIMGHIPREPFDSMYFHAFYNYGLIISIIGLFAYTAAMWYSNKKEKYYDTIALAVMSVYGFMELFPLSIVWNFSLLFLAQVVFKEGNQCIKKRKK